MIRGVIISVVLHAALLAWSIVSITSMTALPRDETPSIAVSIITPSELLRLKQGDPDAKELEAKATEEPKPDVSKKEAEKVKPIAAPPAAAAPPPAPPEPEPVPAEPPPPEPAKAEPPKADPPPEKQVAAAPPEPAPGPTAEELAKEEAKKAEEAKKIEDERKAKEADEKKKTDDKKKADEQKRKRAEDKKLADAKKKKEDEAKKKKFDPDRIAALLDKTPDKRGAPRSATAPTNPTDYKGPTAGEREGRDTVLSAREVDILKGRISAQLRRCWKLPGGGGGIETVVVTLRWRMKPDGSLDGEPVIDQPQSGPVFQIAAEAAMRAVKLCQPFELPPDNYEAWKSIIWDFDPREML